MLYKVGGYAFDVYLENGYYKDKITDEFVHRIIAMKKFNRNFLHWWEVVHHIDGNKLNNNPKNLYICYHEFHDIIHQLNITEDNFWSFVYEMKQAHKI